MKFLGVIFLIISFYLAYILRIKKELTSLFYSSNFCMYGHRRLYFWKTIKGP